MNLTLNVIGYKWPINEFDHELLQRVMKWSFDCIRIRVQLLFNEHMCSYVELVTATT